MAKRERNRMGCNRFEVVKGFEDVGVELPQ